MAHQYLRSGLAAAVAIAFAATLTACSDSGRSSTSTATAPATAEVNPSGDIPDNQAYVRYNDPQGRFAIALPEGWARSSSGTAVTFSDKLNSVRISTGASAAPPTPQTGLAAAKKDASGRNPGAMVTKTARRRAGDAIVVTYEADAPKNAVTNKATRDAIESYTFWKNGTLTQVTLSAPTGADNVDPWRMITDSFTWSAG